MRKKSFELGFISEGELLRGVQTLEAPKVKYLLRVTPEHSYLASVRTEAKPVKEGEWYSKRYNLRIVEDEKVKMGILTRE